MFLRYIITLSAVILPAIALAQPSLDSLWPNADGLRWEFEFSATNSIGGLDYTAPAAMWFQGTVVTPGGTAQVLNADHGIPMKTAGASQLDPVLHAVWRARPDLRRAIEARAAASNIEGSAWWPLLLHDGYFMKTATSIQMWQPSWDHPTWTYMTSDLREGATFTQQLVPELADDVFLHGTVESIDATVATAAGIFEHAVRMQYVIDYGWTEGVDENQNFIGMLRSETRGHVHFVPEVGPVDMLEDFFPFVEIDCAPNACPQEWIDQLGISVQTLILSLTQTVAVESTSWARVKGLYQ